MTISATGNRMSIEIGRQSRLAQEIARTQISISTGRRFQAASEAPLAAEQVDRLDRARSDSTTWRGNLSLATSLATQADSVLSSLSDGMVHARELAIGGASGTATVADRATYAAELRSLADNVATLRASETPQGQPLFATGASPRMRVDSNEVLAPVDSAANIFEIGGTSLTQILTDAATALESGDAARIAASLDVLGGAIGHVADAAAGQGVRARRIDTLIDRNATHDIDLNAERSGLADTDLTTAIATLNAQQLTLDAAQAAFARINRRSLFDILG